jgi:hypothetical protein
MPQVTRTTNDAIVNSLYLLGELGVGEIPDAFMLSTGLELLNELLDKFSSDSIYIPYLTTLNFNFTVGQDTYSISDIIAGTNIVADRVVDLTFANYVVPGFPVTSGPASSSYITNFLTNSDLILNTTAAFPTGTAVTLSVTNGGILSTPLQPNIVYYVINIDINHLQLATTPTNAQNGVFIVLTSDGAGTGEQIITATTQTIPLPAGGAQNIVYPMRIINKATYNNVVRLQNLLARPGFIFLNKQPTESFITVYPSPDQPYPVILQVKSMLNSLTADQDLTGLPPYYYGFLKYALGRKFLAYYPSGNWPQQNEEEYTDYYNNLKNANETDLTIRPSMIMNAPEPFYWPNILAY